MEFLASTDVWFRPCNFANAPDGNLYVTDIYRQVIETPESIPEEIRKKINFYNGDTMGRIYRIVPNHPLRQGRSEAEPWRVELGRLVKQSREPERLAPRDGAPASAGTAGSVRDSGVEDDGGTAASPEARVHALWLLQAFGRWRRRKSSARSKIRCAHPASRRCD